jgi:hypothetical protein
VVATLTHRPENSAFSACDDISLGQMVLFDRFSCRLFMSSPNGQLFIKNTVMGWENGDSLSNQLGESPLTILVLP